VVDLPRHDLVQPDGAPGIAHHHLGRLFCIDCASIDESPVPISPSFIDGDDRVYVSRLPTIPVDDTCVACDPILGRTALTQTGSEPLVSVGPTLPLVITGHGDCSSKRPWWDRHRDGRHHNGRQHDGPHRDGRLWKGGR